MKMFSLKSVPTAIMGKGLIAVVLVSWQTVDALPRLRCEQGRRDLAATDWQNVAKELSKKERPYDTCVPMQVQGFPAIQEFVELCTEFMSNGLMSRRFAEWKAEEFFSIPKGQIGRSEPLATTPFATATSRLIDIIRGDHKVKMRKPLPEPLPYITGDIDALDLLPSAYYLRKHRIFDSSKTCVDAKIHKTDTIVWKNVLSKAIPCANVSNCPYIRLALFPQAASCSEQRNRIVSIVLPTSSEGVSHLSSHVAELSGLIELRMFVDIAGSLPVALPAGLKNLEMLKVAQPHLLPSDAPLKWLDISRLYIKVADASVTASKLEPVCNYKGLRYFNMYENVFQGVPSCFGSLTELRSLELSKNRFGDGLARPEDALPTELASLSNLVMFNAWGQGIAHVQAESQCPTDSECVLDFETALDTFRDNRPPVFEKYHCPDRSWGVDVTLLRPVFSWKKLEMFWVDASGAGASKEFFDQAAEAWPLLRSLDLYDNKIYLDASALASLSKLPFLWQIMMAKNQFYGTLPSEFITGAHRVVDWLPGRLHMAFNTQLHGCLPKQAHDRAILTGTQIVVCKDKKAKNTKKAKTEKKAMSEKSEL